MAKHIQSDRVCGRARPVLQLGNAAQTYPLRCSGLDKSRKQFEIESPVQSSYGQSAEVVTLVDNVCTMLKTGSSCELVEIHLWRCVHRSGFSWKSWGDALVNFRLLRSGTFTETVLV